MTTDNERKAFEQFMELKITPKYQAYVGDKINYDSFSAKLAWETWQAARAEQDDDLRSIFRRIVDIIGFHDGDDLEKVEAIRQVMLTAKHLQPPKQGE